ncbi:MAG: rhomboid family intramembrane serine protease [Desulfatitalea sp.]|nr:rhomboid family intramembrane serine protease [Desulfatitalea sp.]NNK00245.1 rhomboid family intramembrane serine protease [Desulfatitalea sp.]
MIPIRDTTPSKNVPVINNILIALNIAVFLLQMMLGSERVIFEFGLIPARYTVYGWDPHIPAFQKQFAWVSFMFLHGGFFHLLGNMWSLYIFGDNVEDRLGPLRYLAFYLLCGIASGLSHLIINAHSASPTIGASGAIAGVMGAYFILYPRSRILTLIPIVFIPWFVEIPAFVFLGLWFVMQFLSATAASGAAGGIAWWAHIGGFVFGILFLKLFEQLPGTGLTKRVRRATAKKRSHRLQVARPDQPRANADLHATIAVTPYEALVGARKLVNIPSGLQRRLYRVNVPPGVTAGKILRLQGQGKPRPDGTRGDLMLKVLIS